MVNNISSILGHINKRFCCAQINYKSCKAPVKLSPKQGGVTWRSQVGANPIPIPCPTNSALFYFILFHFFIFFLQSVNESYLLLQLGASVESRLQLGEGWIQLCTKFSYLHHQTPVHIVNKKLHWCSQTRATRSGVNQAETLYEAEASTPPGMPGTYPHQYFGWWWH